MKPNSMIRIAAVLMLLFLSPPVSWSALPAAIEGKELPTLAPMLQRVTPAVVNIATQGRVVERSPLLDDPFFRRFFDIPEQRRERRTQGLGSGVIIDSERGYILTNNHVIANADVIMVTLQDERQFEARLVGTDPDTDIAVLQVEADNLTAVAAADSDRLQVGDFVVAIGNPFGLGQTVTSGIVSALGRSGLGIESYEDFIQTDASINPGNSGGALVNLRGDLVGINTAIIGPGGGSIGISFAIPINMAKKIMEQLIEYGEVRRGRLGVSAQDLTPELAQGFGIGQRKGAVITQIVKGSAADKAGLKVGDVLVAVNNRPLRNTLDLRNVIGLLPVGSKLKMEVIRQGRRHTITAIIAVPEVRRLEGGKLSPRLEGAVLSDIGRDSPYFGRVEGVLVAGVALRSPAGQAGLRKGDIILGVNDTQITDLNMLERALQSTSGRLWLNLLRGDSEFYFVLR